MNHNRLLFLKRKYREVILRKIISHINERNPQNLAPAYTTYEDKLFNFIFFNNFKMLFYFEGKVE